MSEFRPVVLLVEDEPTDAELLKQAFARAGFGGLIMVVLNGEEAIEYLVGEGKYADRKAFPYPHWLVTDLKMPQMDGIELLRWTDTHREYRIVPTIVLTSSSSPKDVAMAYAFGAHGYLTKPVSFQDLQKLLRSAADYWKLALRPPEGPHQSW